MGQALVDGVDHSGGGEGGDGHLDGPDLRLSHLGATRTVAGTAATAAHIEPNLGLQVCRELRTDDELVECCSLMVKYSGLDRTSPLN